MIFGVSYFMSILSTAIPVIIETGSVEWPYSVRGTFFTIKINDELYVVTARHVVEGNEVNAVFFRYRSDSRFSLPLDIEIKNTSYTDENSPEYMDVIMYRVKKDEIEENISYAFYDFVNEPWKSLKADDNLIIRGYPSTLQKTQANGVKEQAVIINGKYLNQSRILNCHNMALFPTEEFTFHDGYSGSPVFLLKDAQLNFVGVLVKADSYNNKALFVDGSVLLQMVNS